MLKTVTKTAKTVDEAVEVLTRAAKAVFSELAEKIPKLRFPLMTALKLNLPLRMMQTMMLMTIHTMVTTRTLKAML